MTYQAGQEACDFADARALLLERNLPLCGGRNPSVVRPGARCAPPDTNGPAEGNRMIAVHDLRFTYPGARKEALHGLGS
jgi:hypothetical protein